MPDPALHVPRPAPTPPAPQPEIGAAVEHFARAAGIPGLSLVVVRSAGALFAVNVGSADLAAGTSTGSRTPYLWFSLSKIVTATATLRLVDDGVLDLDAPIRPLLPYEIRGPGEPTVRHLLSHTAGFANPVPVRWVHPAARAPSPQAWRASLERRLRRHARLKHPVGEEARYSNIGYLVLAEIVARTAREPFERYVRRAVLEPAGMDGTGYTHEPGRSTATGYVKAPRLATPALRAVLPGGIVGARHGAYLALRPFTVDGAGYGGLIGPVVDAGRLASLHLGDGAIEGRRILAAGTARAMRELRASGRPYDVGFGWVRDARHRPSPRPFVEHLGGGGGYFNALRLYPDLDLGMAVMTNTTSRYDHHRLFEKLVSLVER